MTDETSRKTPHGEKPRKKDSRGDKTPERFQKLEDQKRKKYKLLDLEDS